MDNGFAMLVETIPRDYRRLRSAGFSEPEASALIALAQGVDADQAVPARVEAWRYEELVRLDFLRYLVETGRLVGD